MKPGNLLLDHHGAVWIADFGLAKLLDHHTLTATGDLLGTIPYMAPEALRGEGDHRADVYGLGMTLYELATGSMPYQHSNPAVVIREIGEKDPPPPRSVNPRVPRDLETILLTAIARDPGRRYPNAAAMAHDLDAFLNDQPIRARRSSAIQRSWLWAKRNPILAMLSTITAGALVFSAIVGWVSYSRTSAALASERKLLSDAEEANKKLLDNLNLSLAAFEAVFDAANPSEPFGFGPPRPPESDGPRNPMRPEGGRPDGGRPEGDRGRPNAPMPGGRALVVDPVKMLEVVLDFYEKFAEQNSANPKLKQENETNYKLRLNAAKAYRKVGQMKSFLGRMEPNAAAQPLHRSLEILNELMRSYPDVKDVQREFVLSVAALDAAKESKFATGERLELVRRAAALVEPGAGATRWTLDQLARMAQSDGDRELAEAIRARMPEFRPPDFRPGGERPNNRPPGDPGPRRQ